MYTITHCFDWPNHVTLPRTEVHITKHDVTQSDARGIFHQSRGYVVGTSSFCWFQTHSPRHVAQFVCKKVK